MCVSSLNSFVRTLGTVSANIGGMLKRTGFLVMLAALIAVPASAQIVQGVHLGGGAFVPRGYDARVDGDVLNENLNSLVFQIKDFTSGQAFGEYFLEFGDHIEIAGGIGYYRGSAPSVYRDYTHPASQGSSEIEQELRLQIVPVTGLVRFLPFGKPSTVQPYVGVGLSALRYRYSESGEFVDFNDFSTFRNRYVTTGVAVGPVVVAGLRFPINGDIWGLTTEWRYQAGSGDTGGSANGFLANKIDLGGSNINFGFLVRF